MSNHNYNRFITVPGNMSGIGWVYDSLNRIYPNFTRRVGDINKELVGKEDRIILFAMGTPAETNAFTTGRIKAEFNPEFVRNAGVLVGYNGKEFPFDGRVWNIMEGGVLPYFREQGCMKTMVERIAEEVNGKYTHLGIKRKVDNQSFEVLDKLGFKIVGEDGIEKYLVRQLDE